MKKFLNIATLMTSVAFLFIIFTVAGAEPYTAIALGIAATAVLNFVPLPKNVLGAFVGAVQMADGETGIQVVSSERERAVYEHNKNQARFKGKNMTPSFLRLEAVITNSKNSFVFKTFEGDGANVYSTEARLDRNDAFIATEMGLFMLRQDITNLKTNAELLSYVNLTKFVAVAGFVPADLEAIYHGFLSITINRVKKLVKLDTQRFRHVPETQQTGATNYDQRSRKDGFIKLTPQIIIDGSGTNELEVFFPSYAGWSGASVTAGTEHRLALYLRGLHVTGGSANT